MDKSAKLLFNKIKKNMSKTLVNRASQASALVANKRISQLFPNVWKNLRRKPGATYDRHRDMKATKEKPMITW